MSITQTDLAAADQQERADYIAGLRELADLLETTPTLPLPDDRDVAWYLFGTDVEGAKKHTEADQRELAAKFVRLLPGEQRKQETGELFRFRGRIGGLGTQVIVDTPAVCKRVVTGTTEVTKTVPAPDAPTIEVTETVETVEWVCEPLLSGVSA